MNISYYLNTGKAKELHCRIKVGKEMESCSLNYKVDAEAWDKEKGELAHDNPYYYALDHFKDYLLERFAELEKEDKTNALEKLKEEAVGIIAPKGIAGIAQKMFDDRNEKDGVPKYETFIQAFEKHSGLKSSNYHAEIIDAGIHFHTDNEEYEMDTYKGRTALLKSFIDRKSYEEIYVMTNESIWSEIYVDAGIEKHVFIPEMLSEWEAYWDRQYIKIKREVGKTDHLDELKAKSWRQFQVFMECYNDHGDSIELALEIDEDVLYPMAVITMMQIFDAETCYSEYCELEFNNGEWESIILDDESDDSPVFYIKPYEG